MLENCICTKPICNSKVRVIQSARHYTLVAEEHHMNCVSSDNFRKCIQTATSLGEKNQGLFNDTQVGSQQCCIAMQAYKINHIGQTL